MGNLYSPTCMMDGHPAYPLKRWAHLLSVRATFNLLVFFSNCM